MNFLAHIFLSGENDKVIIGNFIGDFVKGNDINTFDLDVKRGIQLHRKIDHFTDHHQVVMKSKIRLRPAFRHYAPVIVDMYYDHFLAVNWNDYHPEPLSVYTEEFYRLTERYNNIIPEKARHMLSYMSVQNWLYEYRKMDGIHQALSGLSRRTKFESGMENAVAELETNYEKYQDEFKEFFPELVSMASDYLKIENQ